MIALVLAVGGIWLTASVVTGLAFGAFVQAGRAERLPVENKSRGTILEVAGQGGR